MSDDLQQRLDRFIVQNLALKRRLRTSLIGNAVLGVAVIVLILVVSFTPSSLPVKHAVVTAPTLVATPTTVAPTPAAEIDATKPVLPAPVSATSPDATPPSQTVERKELPSAVVPDGATPQEAYAIKVAARSARYGLDVIAKLDDLGPQTPSGEVPPDFIGKYYYASFTKDSTDIDQILTPHFMELSAETMSWRDDSDDGQTVRPIHEPKPISVWLIKDGFLTKPSERSSTTTVFRRTNLAGLFLMSEYSVRRGDVLRAPRFIVLKR